MASAIPSPPPSKRTKWASTDAPDAPEDAQNAWDAQSNSHKAPTPSVPVVPSVSVSVSVSVPSETLTGAGAGGDSGFSDATGEESQESFQNNGDSKPAEESLAGPSGLLPPGAVDASTGRATAHTGNEEDVSEISGMSDLSGADWKANAGPFSWVQSQMLKGADPRELLQGMLSEDTEIPPDLDQITLWKIILNMLSEPPRRQKLDFVNTIDNVAELIKKSKNILVLTGAGVSVSCGIPDFRSKDGVYARLAVDFPDLPDPQAMFDIQYFRRDPRPFFKFAKEIYPGQFQPSPCHKFIRNLEKQNRLLRNYTQNIDTLEQQAGLERVVQCHGSFATATCTKCDRKVDAEQIREEIFQQRIPYCPTCQERIANSSPPQPAEASSQPEPSSATEAPSSSSNITVTPQPPQPGIMKPDIVFFGEGLGDEFHRSVAKDKEDVDLLIMIGSSLKVRPVALIPSSIPTTVPQILINREPLSHLTPDVTLLGDCDSIVNQLTFLLGEGWEDAKHKERLGEVLELRPEDVVGAEIASKEAANAPVKKEEEKETKETDQVQDDKKEEPSENGEDTKSEPKEEFKSEPKEKSKSELKEESKSEPKEETKSEPEDKMETTTPKEAAASEEKQETGTADKPVESLDSAPKEDTAAEHEKIHQHLPSDPKPDPSDWHPRSRPRPRLSLSARLPEGSYFFQPPSTYVFPGAEVYEGSDDEDEDDDSSSSSEDEGDEPVPDDVGEQPSQQQQQQHEQTPPPTGSDVEELEPSILELSEEAHEALQEDVQGETMETN